MSTKKLIAVQTFDHDGLKKVGDVVELPDQTANALVSAGLCQLYTKKLAEKLVQQKVDAVLADSQVVNAGDAGTGGKEAEAQKAAAKK